MIFLSFSYLSLFIRSCSNHFHRLKKLRQDVKDLIVAYDRTEDDLKAIQSVGMLIGDVLKQLDEDKFII